MAATINIFNEFPLVHPISVQ